MDSTHARNYWRKAFVEASDGRFSPSQFDEWFPGSPGNGEFNDQILDAFERMIEACVESGIGGPTRGR